MLVDAGGRRIVTLWSSNGVMLGGILFVIARAGTPPGRSVGRYWKATETPIVTRARRSL